MALCCICKEVEVTTENAAVVRLGAGHRGDWVAPDCRECRRMYQYLKVLSSLTPQERRIKELKNERQLLLCKYAIRHLDTQSKTDIRELSRYVVKTKRLKEIDREIQECT